MISTRDLMWEAARLLAELPLEVDDFGTTDRAVAKDWWARKRDLLERIQVVYDETVPAGTDDGPPMKGPVFPSPRLDPLEAARLDERRTERKSRCPRCNVGIPGEKCWGCGYVRSST